MTAHGLKQGDVAVALGAKNKLDASIGRAIGRGSAINNPSMAAALGPWLDKMESAHAVVESSRSDTSEPETIEHQVEEGAAADEPAPVELEPIEPAEPILEDAVDPATALDTVVEVVGAESRSGTMEAIRLYQQKEAERKSRVRAKRGELQRLKREAKAAASAERKRAADRERIARKRAEAKASTSSAGSTPLDHSQLLAGVRRRMDALRDATAAPRLSPSMRKLKGREEHLAKWWMARELARHQFGPNSTAMQVADWRTKMDRGAGDGYSKKQAENAIARLRDFEAPGGVWCDIE